MTRSYIKDGVFRIETDDKEIVEEVLDRIETHIYSDVKAQDYVKADDRIKAFIEMDNNFRFWKMEKETKHE